MTDPTSRFDDSPTHASGGGPGGTTPDPVGGAPGPWRAFTALRWWERSSAPFGPRRRPSAGRNWMARLAGAQVELFDEALDDRPRFVALGGVLLTTAVLAAVSSAFALYTALGLGLVPSVLAGAVWGVMICNLDRMMVLGLKRQAGWVANVLSALPRVFLALVIGTVISVPLVLQIFQPEINGELQVMRVERQARNGELVRQADARIDAQQRIVDDLQKRAAGNGLATANQDPEVQRLQGLLTAKRDELARAEQAFAGEVDGTSGSGVAGPGPATDARRQVRDRLQQETTDLETQLRAATEKAQVGADQAARQQQQQAANGVRDAEQVLSDLRTQKVADQEGFAAAEATGDGLLARIEALGRLAGTRADLNLTRWTLTVLFALLELLPVIVKLLSVFGPPSAYDQLVARQDEDVAARSTAEIERRKTREKIRTDEDRAVEEQDSQARITARDDLRRRQAALSAPVNDTQIEAAEAMVQQWRRASAAALETWKEVYDKLNQAELERWKRAQLASAARAAGETTQPLPVQRTAPVRTPWSSPPPVAPATDWERTVPPVRNGPGADAPRSRPVRTPGGQRPGQGPGAPPPSYRAGPGTGQRGPARHGSAPPSTNRQTGRPSVSADRLLDAGRRLRRWVSDVARSRS